jgi:hypothetical protein
MSKAEEEKRKTLQSEKCLEGKSSSSTFLTRKNNKRKKARDKIITLKTQKLRARFRF